MTETADFPLPAVKKIDSELTLRNRLDHFQARWGINRMGHRVAPGLYALGSPTPDSPVFVTANYTLSFDALRSALTGHDGWILVLNTYGINVWCAAGKETFSTDELVKRVQSVNMAEVVAHRTLILPQLGAPGVTAHQVKKETKFKVEYGPVRADDLPEYLISRQATAEMRRVRFDLPDRLAVIPVELVHTILPMLAAALVLWFLDGRRGSTGAVMSIMAGVVLFPILLPWLPSKDFSLKGFILGAIVAVPFAISSFISPPISRQWLQVALVLVYFLGMPSVTAYLALNYTGSTTFTSKSAVKREMAKYIPVMAWCLGISVILLLGINVYKFVV